MPLLVSLSLPTVSLSEAKNQSGWVKAPGNTTRLTWYVQSLALTRLD